MSVSIRVSNVFSWVGFVLLVTSLSAAATVGFLYANEENVPLTVSCDNLRDDLLLSVSEARPDLASNFEIDRCTSYVSVIRKDGELVWSYSDKYVKPFEDSDEVQALLSLSFYSLCAYAGIAVLTYIWMGSFRFLPWRSFKKGP